VSKAEFAKQSAIYLVFYGKEKLRSLSNCSENPITRFSWQRLDGSVEAVTCIPVPYSYQRDTASDLRLRFHLNVATKQETVNGSANCQRLVETVEALPWTFPSPQFGRPTPACANASQAIDKNQHLEQALVDRPLEGLLLR